MRRALGVAALCLFVALNVSAGDVLEKQVPRDKESPLAKVVRVIKLTVGGLGDLLTGPRP